MRRLCQSGQRLWVVPAGFKGARDARYAMWVSMLGMWGCRVVVGYTLGIVLGWGVVGVWMGMFSDWAVRAILFYRRMKTGKWLWKYRGHTLKRWKNKRLWRNLMRNEEYFSKRSGI